MKNNGKTVAQIVDEHNKRQEDPEFLLLVFQGDYKYFNVTNFVRHGNKLDCEFDSIHNGEVKHVKAFGYPVIEEAFVKNVERPVKMIAESCKTVTVRKGSGTVAKFDNVTTLCERVNDKGKDIVEFDTEEGHTMTEGDILEYTGST